MGEYIYRVTAQLVKLSDGRKAHVAKFAYKPYSNAALNDKLYFSSGCTASDRLVPKSNLIATIDPEKGTGTLYENKNGYNVFSDYAFGTTGMPKTGELRREEKVWAVD